jgi:plasmid stabilization system protein ParE
VKRRRLKLLRRASHQISEAAAWWAANRPSAPKALVRDLRQALRAIAEQPNAGRSVKDAKFQNVRRVHLARIRYYLYYRLNPDDDTVEILAFWHSSRGAGPPV